MSETKFRIGGYYKQRDGRVVELAEFKYGNEPGTGWARMPDGLGEGFRRLLDGSDTKEHLGAERDLLPGELHNVNGQWVPVAEEAPKPAEEQEFCDRLALDAAADLANAAMIARDGPAKQLMPCTCGIPVTGVIHRLDGPCYQAEPKSTAKPALDGLTRIGAMSHMLGSAFLKG